MILNHNFTFSLWFRTQNFRCGQKIKPLEPLWCISDQYPPMGGYVEILRACMHGCLLDLGDRNIKLLDKLRFLKKALSKWLNILTAVLWSKVS